MTPVLAVGVAVSYRALVWRSQARLRRRVDGLVEQFYDTAVKHLTTRADRRDDFERLEREIEVEAIKLRRRSARKLIVGAARACRQALTAKDFSFEQRRALQDGMKAAVDEVHRKAGRRGKEPADPRS